MSQLTAMINELNPTMTGGRVSSDRVEEIINQHAVGAAATALGAGLLTSAFPVASVLVDALISTGLIWSMYYRVSKELNIPMSKNLLKTLGSACLTNIVANLGGVLVTELAAACVPFFGVAVTAAICYGVTYLAGYLFIKLLVSVFKAGKRPEQMTAEELAAVSRSVAADTNCAQIFRGANADAKDRIRRGEISRDNTISAEAD